MNNAERQLMRRLRGGVNHADEAMPVMAAQANKAQLVAQAGNPQFMAQFDVQVLTKYYTQVTATGVFTEIAASALNAALKNRLAFFFFGQSDFVSGYKRLKELYPLNSNWTYGIPFIYGSQNPTWTGDSTGVVAANLVTGDLVLPIFSALPGAGTTTMATVVLRCQSIAFGTLLGMLQSDKFLLNMIRYVITDSGQYAQYQNQVGLLNQSIFGKFDSDQLSPTSFKTPEQFQDGIIDIPIKQEITKQKAYASYLDYTAVNLLWSIFVLRVDKL